MDAREQRGLVIAALCKLNHNGESWVVPSQSGTDVMYKVNPQKQTCTCPDHSESGFKCKHIYAVEITMKREVAANGMIRETKSITFTEEKTYTQNWSAYNRAQSIEKDRFQELLYDLCQGIEEPERTGRGRKPHLRKDAIFAMVLKVYGTLSARRESYDMREAHSRGFLTKPIPGMKVNVLMEKPEHADILRQLIARSAAPLKSVETDFAIDSSGFSTSRFERWYDQKYGVTRQRCDWVKVHVCSGVKTNIITAVRILDKDAADSPQFAPLVSETARTFTISEVSADKAYTGTENFEAVAAFGGMAYLPFKTNTTGGIGGTFKKMFHYFQLHQEEYMEKYHKRSNVETTFSMMKRKFGDFIRSKLDAAMINEVLCKVLAHNLCVLVQEECELGIKSNFSGETRLATLAV